MGAFVWFGPSARHLAALVAVAVLAAAGGQAACAAGGIEVVGGTQVVLDVPGVGLLMDVAAFEAFDGHSYLLALGYDSIHTINVTDPFDPVLAGGITGDQFIERWFEGVVVFHTPDGRVYAAVTGDGILILDVTDPANPEIIDGAPRGADNPSAFGDAWKVTVSERPDGRVHALVAGSNNALRTVDITDPRHPVSLGGGPNLVPAMTVGGSAAAFFEPGDGRTYLVYGSVSEGAFIVDVTDPARHILISAIRHYDGGHPLGHEDPFRAYGIPAPSSSDVLIADGYAEGLGYASEVVIFSSPEGRTYAMVANGDATIHIGESDPYVVSAGIIFLDVTNPHAPVPAGAVLDGEGGFDFDSSIHDIAILESPGGRIHAAVAGGQDVVILDVTDPAGPVTVSHIRDVKGGFDYIDTVRGMVAIESPDGHAYLAMAGDRGIHIADMTNPDEPAPAGGIPSQSATFHGPVVFGSGGGRAYALGVGGDAVSMVDITDPRLPVPLDSVRDGEGGFDALEGVWRVEVLHAPDGHVYAMAAGREGLQVIEVTDPHSPAPAGVLPNEGRKLIDEYGRLPAAPVGILRNGTGGLEVGWFVSTAVLQQSGGRDYLLVADHDRGIHTVDVTDPRSPVLAGSLLGGEGGIDLLGGIHDMDVFEAPGGRPYALMTGDHGIHTIDMADPTTPVVAGTLDGSINGAIGGHTLTLVHQSVVFGSAGGRVYALLADYTSGIHIVDLTDPHAPEHAGSVPAGEGGVEVIPGSAVAAVASPDGRAYALVTGWDEIQILEITDPHAPAPVASIPSGEGGLGLERTPWDIITLELAGGRIHVLASGGDRLWVLDVTYPVSPAVPHAGGWNWEDISGSDGDPPDGRTAEASGPLRPGSAGIIVPGPTGDVAITESPDGRTYMMWADPTGGLVAVEVAGPHAADGPGSWWLSPRKAGWPAAVPDGPGPASGSAVELFRPHDGRTYMMVGGGDTIRVVDVTYPDAPAPAAAIRDNLGGFYSLGGIGDISAFASPDGRVLALAGSGDGIQMIDVTNPYSPAPAGSIREVPGIPAYEGIRRIAAIPAPDGRVIALAADGAGRAGMLDVTDPRLPVPMGAIPPAEDAGPIRGMAVFEAPGGHTHVLLAGEDTSRVIDITNPGDPVVVASFGAAAPEGPEGGPHAEGGGAGVTIQAGSSDAGCADGDGCYYAPRTVTIGVGDTVTWRNGDDTAHGFCSMLDADDGKIPAFCATGLLPGAEFSHRFEEAGEYAYFGVPHPWMTGRVVVE